MNNKGQTLMISVGVAAILFIFGMLFMNFIRDDVSLSRTTANLDCTNSSITDGNKATCLVVDGVIPIFIIAIIAIAGGLITERLLV